MDSKKVALVTGASRGLGLEWVRQLASEGYRVWLTARNAGQANLLAEKFCNEGLDVVGEVLDVSDEQDIARLALKFSTKESRLDILINNAGINSKDDPDKEVFYRSFLLDKLDPEEVLRHIRINSLGPVLMVKHFKPFLKNGTDKKVISISSWIGSIAQKNTGGHYSYSTSKSALNMLNRAMAFEVIKDEIICVTVNPGWVKTDMGGSKAEFTTEQSVKNLLKNVVYLITISDTGRFINFDGSDFDW